MQRKKFASEFFDVLTIKDLIDNIIRKGKDPEPNSKAVRNLLLGELYLRNPDAHDAWRAKEGHTDEDLYKYFGL